MANTTKVDFNPKVLSLLKDLTTISGSVVIQREKEKFYISQINEYESLIYIMKGPIALLYFEGDNMSFRDFSEFYQIYTSLNDPKIEESLSHLILKDGSTKINYLLSEAETLTSELGPTQNDIPDETKVIDASIQISESELVELRKMINLIKAEKVRITTNKKQQNIVFYFYNDEISNSIERTYKSDVEVKKDLDYVSTSLIFTNVPKNDYVYNFNHYGLTNIKYQSDVVELLIFSGEQTA